MVRALCRASGGLFRNGAKHYFFFQLYDSQLLISGRSRNSSLLCPIHQEPGSRYQRTRILEHEAEHTLMSSIRRTNGGLLVKSNNPSSSVKDEMFLYYLSDYYGLQDGSSPRFYLQVSVFKETHLLFFNSLSYIRIHFNINRDHRSL
jgi:hypothetical protein